VPPSDPQADRPYVFVIMPFDRAWQDLYEFGVKGACEAAGATCARADEHIFLQNILDRLYEEIDRADLVVAELSDHNPNVYYETGYAHGIGKPVILLTKSADDIPFDLLHYPHVVHEGSIATLRQALEERVRWCIEHPEEANRGRRGQAELDRMAQHITNYLRANDLGMVSFDRVRRNINPGYSDEKLLQLIDGSPSQFRRVRLQGGRPGIGLVG